MLQAMKHGLESREVAGEHVASHETWLRELRSSWWVCCKPWNMAFST